MQLTKMFLLKILKVNLIYLDLQMLLLVLVAAAGFFLVVLLPRGDYWQLFSYLVIAFAGLVLILQPRPDEEVPRRGEAAQKSL